MHTLLATETVIDALGGTAAVARITGRTQQAVSNWRVRTKFPSDTFLILNDALTLKGMSAPSSLWGMSSVRSAQEPERAST